MLQQVMTAPGKIAFQELPTPEPKDDEVLVQIMRIGVCGSDIHVFHGKHPFTKYPITQGHEVSGKVVKLGAAVNGFAIGQRVTIEPQVFCGKCYPSRHVKYYLCDSLKVMGFQTTGAASEFFAVSASKVTPLPNDMTFDQGAMIEPLAVTVHAVRRAEDVSGKKIAVLGAGPIGILLAQSAKAMGASQTLITDISDHRVALAKTCGADYVGNTSKTDFEAAMVEHFGPDKADVIYDCAGNDTTINQAIRGARKGSVLILVAVFADMAKADLAVLNDHELDLNTSMMYRHEDYVDAIRLVQEKKVMLEPLMSKHFAFQDYLNAYRYIDEHRETTMKVLIDVDGSEE